MISDPYSSTDRCVDRLINVYKNYGKLIVGFDFDDTIYDYHATGYTFTDATKLLQECSDLGFVMCLMCCKENEQDLIVNKFFCEDKLKIRVDYINSSPVMQSSRKPFVNILLDDKAGLGQAMDILEQTLRSIKIAK